MYKSTAVSMGAEVSPKDPSTRPVKSAEVKKGEERESMGGGGI